LSAQYRVIKKYVSEGRFVVKEDGLSFFKAVGHSEALRNARDYNILASDIKYITAKGVDDVTIRVITTPEVIDGKTTVATTVTVLGENNHVIREISSNTMEAKAFNEAIFEFADEYGLKECQTSKKNIRGNIL
jgi:hypothetical protein